MTEITIGLDNETAPVQNARAALAHERKRVDDMLARAEIASAR